MSNKLPVKISGYTELNLRIMHLKSDKFEQEQEIKRNVQLLGQSLNPMNLIRNSLHGFTQDNETKMDLAMMALKLGSNFLIHRVLKRYGGVVGFVGSVVLGKLSASLIRNNVPNLVAGVNNFLKSRQEKEDTEEITYI